MNDLLAASGRLALSREHIRQALHADATAPGTDASPLRIAAGLAAQAVQSAVRPLAQQHPLGLVLGAAVTGGILAWSRPWRWLLTPVLISSVLPQLVAKLVGGTQPLSWMRLLTSLTRRQHNPNRAVPRQDR